jgi:ribosomal protein S27AE
LPRSVACAGRLCPRCAAGAALARLDHKIHKGGWHMAGRITYSDRSHLAGLFALVVGLANLGFGGNVWLSLSVALLAWFSTIAICHIINRVNGHKHDDEPI